MIAGSVKGQCLGLTSGQANGGGAGLCVNRGHFAACAVDPSRLTVVAGELDAVAGFEFERLRREHLAVARTPLPQAPIHLTPVLGFQGDGGFGRVNAIDAVGFAAHNALVSIIASEADNIAFVVAQGIASLGAGQPLVGKTLHGDGGAGKCARLGECGTNIAGQRVAPLARRLDDQHRKRTLSAEKLGALQQQIESLTAQKATSVAHRDAERGAGARDG